MADFLNRAMGRQFNAASLLKFTDLDPRVQTHLVRVYATLTVALCLTTLGVVADLAWGVGGSGLTLLAMMGSALWLTFAAPTPENKTKRLALLGTFAFCQGTSLGPLIGVALTVDPSIVLTAALSTTAVFASFSLSALTTRRRSYLFLGGWLSSALLGLLAMRLGSFIFALSKLAYGAELYLGLLIFAGYVLFDTQLIVERASAGDFDEVRASTDLFLDFIAILVRVLAILLRNQEKRESEERRRRRRD